MGKAKSCKSISVESPMVVPEEFSTEIVEMVIQKVNKKSTLGAT